jgi:hypothetical protein
MLLRRWVTALTLVSLTFLGVPAARAQNGADKYFPDGTNLVVQVNLNQLLGSTLLHKGIPLVVKKYGEDALNMIANFVPDENAKKMMTDLAPQLKEKVNEQAVTQFMMMGKMAVQDFVVAINAKENQDNQPQLVMILRVPAIQPQMVGQFTGMAAASGQVKVKEEKVGNHTIFEFESPQAPQPFFMCVPENGIMVMSPFKASLEGVLKQNAMGKVEPKFKELLGQRKPGYTVFAAGVAPKDKEDDVKHFIATLTLDKDVNGDINLECKDAEAAQAQAKKMNEGLENALEGIKGFAADRPELKPLTEAIGKMKAEAKGSTVTGKLTLNGDDLLKAMRDSMK